MKITIDMDDQDFDQLSDTSMAWGPSWQHHINDGRFEHMEKHYATEPRTDWAMVYWLGNDWTHVILAKAFLKSKRQKFEVIFDQAELIPSEPGSYAILTNYKTKTWREHS